jgi:radical SAM superfamily enzyme YgiQ (UPF0313 family)
MKVVLVGAQINPRTRHTLAVGVLKAAADGHEGLRGRVDVRCLEFTGARSAEILQAIIDEKPAVACFSCYIWNMELLSSVWGALKAALPEVRIVLGGPQAYPHSDAVLRDHPEVDVIALGEAETTFPALLKAWLEGEPLERVPGLAYRSQGGVLKTPEPPPLQDLDALPSAYLSGSVDIAPTDKAFTIETSRGCPFDCKYCDWPGRLQKVRAFSIDRVVAEVEYIVKRAPGVAKFMLADSDIFIDKARARELLTRLKAALAGTKAVLAMEVYLARLDASLIEVLDSKHILLEAGIQTITPEALKAVDRFFNRAKTEEVILELHRRCPSLTFTLETIFGLPGDSFEYFRRTIDWALSMKPDGIEIFPALVLPGADMGMHPENYEIEFEPEPPHRILSSARYGREDMRRTNRLAFQIDALNHFSFLRKVFARLGAHLAREGRLGHLECYEEFSTRLERRGLLPSDESANAGDGAGVLSAAAAMRIMEDDGKTDALYAELEDFVREKLAGGSERLEGMFVRFLKIHRNQELWMRPLRLGRTPAPLQKALSSVRRGRWVGAEDLFPESLILRDKFPALSFIHVAIPGRARTAHCFGIEAEHAGDARELASRLSSGAPGEDAIFFSNTYTRLESSARRRLARALRERARPGGRLLIFDDLLGWSPLESLGKIALDAAEDDNSLPLDGFLAELEEAGWRHDAPAERFDPFVLVSMVR